MFLRWSKEADSFCDTVCVCVEKEDEKLFTFCICFVHELGKDKQQHCIGIGKSKGNLS